MPHDWNERITAAERGRQGAFISEIRWDVDNGAGVNSRQTVSFCLHLNTIHVNQITDVSGMARLL